MDFIVYKITSGKNNITKIEIPCQTTLQEYIAKRYVTSNGKINSADDNPNQIILNAFPLDLSKNLEIVVVDVWLISPWPENLIKKIPRVSKKILFIKEKVNDETNSKNITNEE